MDHETTFRATDSASPPQTDDHVVTWDIELPEQTPVQTRDPFIRLEPIGHHRLETVDGVKHAYYYMGEQPEFIARCDNLDIGRQSFETYRNGPVYSMECIGGINEEWTRGFINIQLTVDAVNLNWKSGALNSMVSQRQQPSINSRSYITFGYQYGRPRIESIAPDGSLSYDTRTDRLQVQNVQPDGLYITIPGTNFRHSIIVQHEYEAFLFVHRNPSGLRRNAPRIPYYVQRTDPDTNRAYYSRRPPGANVLAFNNVRDGYTRRIASDKVVVHWVPRTLEWQRQQADLALVTGSTVENLPGATGGLAPYQYWLHGTLPPGLSVAGSTTDSHGNRIAQPSAEAPVITGSVSAGARGRYPLTLEVRDGAGAGRGGSQNIVQSFVLTAN